MTNPGYAAFKTARDFLIEHRTDYATAIDGFSWPDVGDQFNWSVDWFDVVAKDNDKLALWIIEEDGHEDKVTYEQMRRRSDAAAMWLRQAGIGYGDRTMIMLENQLDLWEIMLGIMKLGAVIMPTTTVLGEAEVRDRIERGDIAHVITSAENTDKFVNIEGDFGRIVTEGQAAGWQHYEDAHIDNDTDVQLSERLVEVNSADPSLIYFTSGTTSLPKMVEHSQISYPVGHLSTLYWLGLQPGDIHCTISSPGWGKHAWSCFFTPWIAEATIVVLNYRRFSAAHLDHELARVGVTTFCAPPTVWRMLLHLEKTDGPGALRELLSAGEPLNPEVIDRVQEMWGLPIRDGYGQTETTALIGNTPGQPIKAGSMGKPLPGVEIVLVDPGTDQVVTDDVVDEAEMCVSLANDPTNLMTRYIGDAEREATARRHGRYHTCDVAKRDKDGLISFIGRTDDVFKASDFKVSPFEVESVLIRCPAVSESAVVGAPDDVRLNVVKAYVQLSPGWEPTKATAFEILKFCRENLPPYERVRRVEFAELPKTISGKIRRVVLRNDEVAAHSAGVRRATEWREQDFPNLKQSKH